MNQPDVVQSRRMDRNTRRETILQTALEIFQEKGYEGTSLNAIIERIGGSKRNFYTEFGGKEGLFKALFTEKIEQQIREQEMDDAVEKDLRTTLLGVSRRIVGSFTDPDLLVLYRFAIQDGMRFPEIVEMFFKGAHLRAEGYIAKLLEKAVVGGEAKTAPSSEVAAEHFINLMHGKLFYELLFGLRDTLTDEEAEAFSRSAVDLFLYGVAK